MRVSLNVGSLELGVGSFPAFICPHSPPSTLSFPFPLPGMETWKRNLLWKPTGNNMETAPQPQGTRSASWKRPGNEEKRNGAPLLLCAPLSPCAPVHSEKNGILSPFTPPGWQICVARNENAEDCYRPEHWQAREELRMHSKNSLSFKGIPRGRKKLAHHSGARPRLRSNR